MSNKECLIYDSDNKVLDKIDINNIVQSYIVERCEKKKEEDSENQLILNKTELNLLQILYSSDVRAMTRSPALKEGSMLAPATIT